MSVETPRKLIGRNVHIEQFKTRADEHTLAHAYIFFGPGGVGKYTFAASLAHYLETGVFAPPPDAALGEEGRPLSDMKTLAPFGEVRSLGIDAVREIKNFLVQKPNQSAYRTLIIDQAEALTTEAQNALLKLTEEPPAAALVILIATDPEVLLPTLRSRIQPVYMPPLEAQEVAEWLESAYKTPKKEALAAAKASFGRPGLAYQMLHDETLKATLRNAEDFLKSNRIQSKEIIKALTDDEEFNFDRFLEALMIKAKELIAEKPFVWHALASLRSEASRSPLNAKLQLTALAQVVQSE
jgi:DNA polymerase III subunit delta'